MRRLNRPARDGRVAATHMVWLPGAYHSPEHFVTAGFHVQVARRRLDIDLSFVDVELAHLTDRRALARLRDEVLRPARSAGCRSLWLAGISLGGFMALDVASSEPDICDGLCVFAPYLGSRLLLNEIERAGGLAAWQPGPLAETDDDRRIWRFVKERPAEGPPLYLGYGREDRFAAGHALLASQLPADAVDVVAGIHDWQTWTTLWTNFLDRRAA